MFGCPIVCTEAHQSSSWHASSSHHRCESFCIGTLHLSIAFWMSNRRVTNLDAKIFAVPLEGTDSKLGPIVGDDPVRDPKSTYDGCHTRFLCQNRLLIVCMTQDQLFHTYGQKCSQITKCHNIEYNYYINNVFED
jgi:hypothetical protein